MKGKCFEIGTIQAFLDGETRPDVSMRLTAHVADCDACAQLMSVAEEENSAVFSTLERELNSLVPTQRLWNRINETIAVEKNNVSLWDKAFAFIRTNLANPSLAAAAGIIIVLGVSALIWVPQEDGYVVTRVLSPPATVDNPPTGSEPVDLVNSPPDETATVYKVDVSNLPASKIRRMVNTADFRQSVDVPNVQYAADSYMPGEEGYVRTIADLKQNVDSQKDVVLTPSTRVSYERDMAVVDDSITRMREVVRKNPRNQAARQVLYSSYQDKIDLLNSVAQREELIASMR